MNTPDVLRITKDQNPAFIQALAEANIKIGDKGTSELKWSLKSQDDESVELIVEAVIPDGYEVDEDGPANTPTPSPTGAESLMTPTAMLVRKKKT